MPLLGAALEQNDEAGEYHVGFITRGRTFEIHP